MDIAESIVDLVQRQQDKEAAMKKIKLEITLSVTLQEVESNDIMRTEQLNVYFQNVNSSHILQVNGVEFTFPCIKCKKNVRNTMYNVFFSFIDGFMEWQFGKNLDVFMEESAIMDLCVSNINSDLTNVKGIDVTDLYIALTNIEEDESPLLKKVRSKEFDQLFQIVWNYVQDILYITNISL